MPLTLVDTEPYVTPNGVGPVLDIQGSLSSGEGDILVFAPTVPGARLWLVAALFARKVALDLTLKSGASKTQTFELAISQGLWDKTGLGYVFCTRPGENLLVACSTTVSSVRFKVIQSERLL